MNKKCIDCSCSHSSTQYLYRNLNKVSTFTGFVSSPKGGIEGLIWIGKDETKHHPIKTEEDMAFFLSEMKKYDK